MKLWTVSLCLAVALSAAVPSLLPNSKFVENLIQANATGDDNSTKTFPESWTWGVSQVPNVLNKSSVDANEEAAGFHLLNVSRSAKGLSGFLRLQKETDLYGLDYDVLKLDVEHQLESRLLVHIEPQNLTDVYKLSSDLVPEPEASNSTILGGDLVFRHSAVNELFWFEVVRKLNAEVLFSTKGNPLVFSNQFVQFNTSLPEGHVITGLGEAIKGFTNPPGTVRTLYANDAADPVDGNIYGVHPFYIDQRYANLSETNAHQGPVNETRYPGVQWGNLTNLTLGNSTVSNLSFYEDFTPLNKSYTHGVWWRTLAPQEVVVEEEALTWRALNGVIDLYFFSGPTPKDVIQQYVSEVGKPALQPYWALGYHQSRWGYSSVDDLQGVVDQFAEADLQLETVWTDLDYMAAFKDFTNDPVKYPLDKFQSFLADLHDGDQKYVPLVDAAIYYPNPNNQTDNNYTVFHDGVEKDVFLKNPDGSLYIGAVWPGYTVFPDFLANSTYEWWKDALEDWRDEIEYDGIWLDMNEASSFCVGSCGSGKVQDNPVRPPFEYGGLQEQFPEGFDKSNATEYKQFLQVLSYNQTGWNASIVLNSTGPSGSNVSNSTVFLNFKQDGKGNINYPPYVLNNAQDGHDLAAHAVSPNATHADGSVEYDVHNLYGYLQTNATYHALTEIQPKKRPFIISRSTFSGLGAYAGHWGGDNWSNFSYAYYSIPQALTLGLSGIPFFGVDVCGFNGNADLELCSRWMQLGAFFPFYRNHNVLGAIDQEPYVWEDVLEHSKITMDIRYSLLPYYYTLLKEASETGVPVLRALSWEFPDDPALSDADRQFFVGEALLVTPVLQPNVSDVDGVFPGANVTDLYYDWYTYEQVNVTDGKNETLEAPLGHIPLHIRGGHVIPLQDPGYTTAESRNNSWTLLVPLGIEGTASGSLYSDDGISYPVGNSTTVEFVAGDGVLTSSAYGDYEIEQPLASVVILGVDEEPSSVRFNNQTVSFDYYNKTIEVTDLEDYTEKGAFQQDFRLSWA